MGACVTVEEDAVAPGKVAPVKGITGVRADGKSTAEDAFDLPQATGDGLAHLAWDQDSKEWDKPFPKPPIAPNDGERCKVVDSYKLMDTETEDVFDRLCDLANDQLQAPFSAVDILDNKKHFFKSVSTQLVLPEDIARERGFPREASCCNYVIRTGKSCIVADMSSDSVFEKNPIFTTLGFRFYASAPLKNKDGFVIGTMCVLSPEPRFDFTAQHKKTMEQIADTAMKQIEIRKQQLDETETAA